MEQPSLNNNYSNIMDTVIPMMMQPFKPFAYMTKETAPPTKQNMNDALSDALFNAIKSISPKPKWLDPTTTAKQWRKFIDEYVSDSPLVIDIMKEIHGVYSNSRDGQFELFVRACRQIHEHLNKSYCTWQESSMSEFLNSDLPFRLYNTYTMSHINKIVAIKQMEKIAKSFQTSMHTAIDNCNRHMRDHYQNEVAKINEQIALSVKSELAVRLFLKCLSESKMQDLFDGDSNITMSGHVKEFNKRFVEFEQSIANLMKTLNVNPSVYTSAIEDASGVKKFQNLLSGYEWWNDNDTKSS